MRKALTLGKLLEQALDMPLLKMPFGRMIIKDSPEDIDIEPTWTAKETIDYLSSFKAGKRFLSMHLEDIIMHNEDIETKKLGRIAFYTVIWSSVIVLGAIIYSSIINKTIPDWESMLLPLVIPGLVVWNHHGVLKAEKLKRAGELLSNLSPSGLKKRFKRKEEPTYPSYPNEDGLEGYGVDPYQDARQRPNNDEGNGNPYR